MAALATELMAGLDYALDGDFLRMSGVIEAIERVLAPHLAIESVPQRRGDRLEPIADQPRKTI